MPFQYSAPKGAGARPRAGSINIQRLQRCVPLDLKFDRSYSQFTDKPG